MSARAFSPELGAETRGHQARRILSAAAYAVRPNRASTLPAVWRAFLAQRLTPASLRQAVPDPGQMAGRADGFAGLCSELSADTLIRAYRTGLFQMSHAGPYKWWSPEQRMALFPDRLHLEKNLKRKLRQGRYTITFNAAFGDVLRHCAGPRSGRKVQLTWLRPDVLEVFHDMHMLGLTHSLEVWNEDGDLAGGLFGTALGQVFFTESQFTLDRDASKIAFAVLNRHLQYWGFVLNDVRLWSSHLERFGCELVSRADHIGIVNTFAGTRQTAFGAEPLDDFCTGLWEPSDEQGWTRAQVMDAAEASMSAAGLNHSDHRDEASRAA